MSTTNVTTKDIRDALRNKHTPSDNVTSPDWVLIEEARSGPGYDGNRGQCDLLAINLYQSRGMHLIGYEIKVSTSDMRAELKQPEKAERFARFCRSWWVVTTPKVWEATQHEIPPNWGVMTLATPGGRLVKKQTPTKREPEAVPGWWWVGWLGQTYRDAHTAMRRDVDTKVRAALEAERNRPSPQHYALEHLRDENAYLKELLEAAGIPDYTPVSKVAELVQVSEAVQHINPTDLAHTAKRLTELAESLLDRPAT